LKPSVFPSLRRLLAAGAAAGAMALSGTAFAQGAWPTKPVKIVVPFAPGGTTDILARAIAPELSKAFGQQFIVDNRAGAGGNVGAEIVSKSPGDGYTLLMGTVGTHGINRALYSKLPYDPIKDFVPITLVAGVPNVMVMNAEKAQALGIHNVADFVRYAKANPGKLNMASSGNGTSIHLAGELFKSMAGVKMLHVPYKGASLALVDLISGHVQLSFISAPGSMQHVEAGRLRLLAVTNAKRSQLLPDVPTISEAGLRGYESEGWHGLFTPAGTPKPAVDRLYKEFSVALRDPKISASLLAGGAEPVGMPSDQFAVKLNDEIEKWAKVVKTSGMKVD
jgi:tripartite-type tricarboxylate transporter receptor subunit TctC